MAKNIVGVDIGTSAIRAVELSGATGSRPRAIRTGEVKLPNAAVSGGEIHDAAVVTQALRTLWRESGFRSKRVVLGMGGPGVLVRNFSVPAGSAASIRESLPFRAQELLPVPASEAVLDFYPMERTSNVEGSQIDGILVAARKERIMRSIDAAQSAGLTVVAADLVPFSLARVQLGVDTSGATTVTALVDIGASTTNVLILAGGTTRFVRIIPTGGEAVTEALIARSGLDREEAVLVKKRLGILPAPRSEQDSDATLEGETGIAHDAIRAVTTELITSIRSTVSYFASTPGGRAVEAVRVTGGGAALPGFLDELGAALNLPVELLPVHTAAVRGRGGSKKALADTMAVALGLALGSAA